MRTSVWPALVVVALMLLASGLVAGSSAGRVAPDHSAPSSVVHVAPPPPSAPPAPTASSSGRGTFFVNYPQPTAPSASPACRYQVSTPCPSARTTPGTRRSPSPPLG